ncbi:MAG: hypothetical protein ACRBFS_26500, partial [Aureispira sp.]
DKKLGQILGGSTVASYYEAQVQSAQDYYAFGWGIPSRTIVKGKEYRFGYQGSEKNSAIDNGSYTTEYRQLDARVARWLSVDPIVHPWQSPYSSMDNSPMYKNDIDGQSGIGRINRKKKTITIRSRFLFYGKRRNTRKEMKNFVRNIAKKVEGDWNGANGTTTIEGVEYKVKFKITGKYIGSDYQKVGRRAGNNTSEANNFIQLVDRGEGNTKSAVYANSAK